MLEVGLPGVCAYVQNKIYQNVVGVVILILSEPACHCSISRVSDFFFYAYLKKRHTGCEKNKVQGMLFTPVISF